MIPVKLTSLLKDYEAGYISDKKLFEGFEVKSVSTDTRQLKSGQMFIAIRGDKYDPHDFIEQAVGAGASGLIVDLEKVQNIKRKCKNFSSLLILGVKDTRKTLGIIARNYLNFFQVKKIVVTGTAGKTSCKGLISSILSTRYNVVESEKSFNNDIGVPLTLLRVDGSTDFLVQEIGTNSPGEIARLSDLVRQDYAMITNIGPAHIGFFGSLENIAKEKKTAIEKLGSEGVAFLNADDSFFEFLSRGISASIKTFGIEKGDLRPRKVERVGVDGASFILKDRIINTKVPGIHGILNCVAASLVGIYFDLDMEEIEKRISDYNPEKGRGRVHRIKGITLIDESYNANPLSVGAVLQTLGKTEVSGRKIMVFADMLELGDKSPDFHREVAEDILRSGITLLYTHGELARITGEECAARGNIAVYSIPDLKEMVIHLKKEIGGGDLVLVKGSRAMNLDRVVKGLLEEKHDPES